MRALKPLEELNVILYSSTISALERAGEWFKGMELLFEMEEKSVKSALMNGSDEKRASGCLGFIRGL